MTSKALALHPKSRKSVWNGVLLALFGVYLYIYPWTVLLVALDRVPVWGMWMGSLLLILQGTLLGLWLAINYGRRGVLVALLMMLLSWAVEHIGVTTGFPFGSYIYTDVLGLKLFGVVPLAVPFAWLLVVPAAIGIIEWLFRRTRITRANMLLRIIGVASFAVLMDVAIEPVSVHIHNYWVWGEASNGFYGVPKENFAAWWGTSFVLAAIYYLVLHPVPARVPARGTGLPVSPVLTESIPPTETAIPALPATAEPQTGWRYRVRSWLHPETEAPFYRWLPPTLYVLTMLMLTIVNLAHGKLLAGAIGSMVIGCLAFLWVQPLLVQWMLGTPAAGQQSIATDTLKPD